VPECRVGITSSAHLDAISLHAIATNSCTCRFGITSFVYRRRRPFHPQRLRETVTRWMPVSRNKETESTAAPENNESPIRTVMRSKGFMWLSSGHATAFYWSHAGQHFEIRCAVVLAGSCCYVVLQCWAPRGGMLVSSRHSRGQQQHLLCWRFFSACSRQLDRCHRKHPDGQGATGVVWMEACLGKQSFKRCLI
jgi:Cobalamin synthesis protein cobW C-terminal domain